MISTCSSPPNRYLNMSEVKGHGYRAIAATLLGGVLAITAARATDAQDPPNAREGRPTCNQDRPPSPAGLFGPGGPSDFGEDRPPPYLRDLALGEDQQDKIFAILHAAAPAMRDHMKAARKARRCAARLRSVVGVHQRKSYGACADTVGSRGAGLAAASTNRSRHHDGADA